MTFQEWWDTKRYDTVPFEATASCFAKAAWDAATKELQAELSTLKSERVAAAGEMRVNIAEMVPGSTVAAQAELRTPPRCPKCGSEEVEVLLQGGNERLWFLWCADCSIPSYNFPTIDAALNAWRKGETK